MSLLSEGGHRLAEVRSVTPGRVLVLRRKFLPEMSAMDPRSALEIYRALMREMMRKIQDAGWV